jgi:hypothetical protein
MVIKTETPLPDLPEPSLSKINHGHAFQTAFFNIRLNIILPSTLKSSNWPLSLTYPTNTVYSQTINFSKGTLMHDASYLNATVSQLFMASDRVTHADRVMTVVT